MAEPPLTPLPEQPAGTPWPTERWPSAARPRPPRAMLWWSAGSPTTAGTAIGEHQSLVSSIEGAWSSSAMARGSGPTSPPLLVDGQEHHPGPGRVRRREGRLDLHAPAPVRRGAATGDPRAAITLDHLLRMASGLKFTEAYLPDQPSDVIAMLFGEGAADVAAFAASLPAGPPAGDGVQLLERHDQHRQPHRGRRLWPRGGRLRTASCASGCSPPWG